MKKVVLSILFICFFSCLNGQSKEEKHQAIVDSVKVFFKAFSSDFQGLGYESDSLKIKTLKSNFIHKYFKDDEFIFPNLMEDDAVYREKRPTLSINNFFKMLPFAYWQGFQFIIDGEQIKVLSVKKSFGKLKEIECLIPVKLWGIKANSRKANRIGEFLKVTLATYQKGNSVQKFVFQKVLFTQQWIFDEPLTNIVLQNIQNELVEDLKTLLKVQKNDNKRKLICQKLQNVLKNDTIFLYTSDKVLKILSINECAKGNYPDELWKMSGVELKSFDLSYVTEIHLSENGQYIGLRCRLQKVNTQSSEKAQWMKNKQNDYVIVSTEVAQRQLSYWQLSNVFIQTLIKQK